MHGLETIQKLNDEKVREAKENERKKFLELLQKQGLPDEVVAELLKELEDKE